MLEGPFSSIKLINVVNKKIIPFIFLLITNDLSKISKLEKLFDDVGLPKTMAEIGLCEDILPFTFKSAKDIRDKYVLPRLSWDLGIIDEVGSLSKAIRKLRSMIEA